MSIKVFFCALLLPVGLLCGCTGEQEDNDLALQLRADRLRRHHDGDGGLWTAGL